MTGPASPAGSASQTHNMQPDSSQQSRPKSCFDRFIETCNNSFQKLILGEKRMKKIKPKADLSLADYDKNYPPKKQKHGCFVNITSIFNESSGVPAPRSSSAPLMHNRLAETKEDTPRKPGRQADQESDNQEGGKLASHRLGSVKMGNFTTGAFSPT